MLQTFFGNCKCQTRYVDITEIASVVGIRILIYMEEVFRFRFNFEIENSILHAPSPCITLCQPSLQTGRMNLHKVCDYLQYMRMLNPKLCYRGSSFTFYLQYFVILKRRIKSARI